MWTGYARSVALPTAVGIGQIWPYHYSSDFLICSFLLPFNLFHFPAWNVFSKQSVALPTALIMYTSLKQSVALPINQCLSTHANPQSKEPSKYHQEFRGGQFSWVQKDKKEFDSDVGSKNAHCWDDAFQTARKCQILALFIWFF